MSSIVIGTEKGAYNLTRTGSSWDVQGPIFPGWRVSAFGRAPSGAYLAAVASNWFGVGVHRSEDLAEWEAIDSPPAWPEETERKMEQIWRFLTVGDRVYAGVAHAGLFSSDDDGETWAPNAGLNEHATRDEWEPGFGGLCAHRILVDGDRMWVAISAVGVFRSDDGGETWNVKNDGVPPAGQPEDSPRPEVGYCVHGLAQDPSNLDTIWRQDHMGMHRTTDGGDNWERINDGLPQDFGFVIWRDQGSGRLFTVPLDADTIFRLPCRSASSYFGPPRAPSELDHRLWSVFGVGRPSEIGIHPVTVFRKLGCVLYVQTAGEMPPEVAAGVAELGQALCAALERLVRADQR